MRNFDDYMTEHLQDPNEAIAYLESALDEYEENNDMESFLLALRRVVEAKGGISKLAEETNLNRQNLYKILTNKANPKFSTLSKIIYSLGFKLSLKASWCDNT